MTIMSARSVQISLDEKLLAAVDRDPETRRLGRSAVIRRALSLYLELKRRREVDQSYHRAYAGRADEVWEEFSDLLRSQSWPNE
jgi:metal-responsive CopG/Arc/MetJ family transcriptional regulator